MALSKNDLAGAAIGETKEVEIKALGGVVRLRELTAKELSDYSKWQAKNEGPSDYEVCCQLGPIALVDDADNALYTPQEFAKIFAAKRPAAVSELAKAIIDMIRQSAYQEDAEKNSEAIELALRRTA
jgi:hypothetical protein